MINDKPRIGTNKQKFIIYKLIIHKFIIYIRYDKRSDTKNKNLNCSSYLNNISI